ncbi:MAG TPA: Holliday junction branch migration protein RuvA, partial [Acidimicrobiales bacterium]|nr:Holliday junction branch migration protein RuvA [Acidimicrobiales bacterium]
VAGVGYRVNVTPRTLGLVGEAGNEVFLNIHHHIREDAQTLYGFLSRDERSCFEALLGAHGVGPALALAILSVHAPNDLRSAVASDDADALCLVPGVGKKTAARLLIDLKARLDVPEIDLTAVNGSGTAQVASSSVAADVRDALSGLGYSTDEVRDAVRGLDDEDDPAVMLRDALRRLATVRSHA